MIRWLPRQGAPSTIRSIKTAASRRPSACRPSCQGAPSTIRCIETRSPLRSRIVTHACQGAPSTTRCIETSQRWGISPAPMAPVRGHPAPPGALRQANRILLHRGLEVRERPAPSGALRRRARARTACTWCGVREHPAPSGALRPVDVAGHVRPAAPVREHPAPSGALRHAVGGALALLRRGQGAPITIRCIETSTGRCGPASSSSPVRGHPAPSGASRHSRIIHTRLDGAKSGSTLHHQVH